MEGEPEAFRAVGQKGHMPGMNHQSKEEWGICPSKYAPDEIRNCMFLLLMKFEIVCFCPDVKGYH